MKIERLEIKGFGRFQNKTFTPGGGMNVIYGFNEAGKTTLQTFIKAMLFGLKGGRRGKDGSLSPTRHYRPWSADSFGGMMEYVLDDGRRFTVGRSFEKNTVYVQDEHANNITGHFPAGKEQGAGFAEQHLGLSENCFERTLFIDQMQTPVDAEGRKVLSERLLNLRESADEGISLHKAIKALKQAQLSHVGRDRTTTRPMNLLEARSAEAARQETELRRLHETRMDHFLELERLKQEKIQLQKRLEAAVSEKEAVLALLSSQKQQELSNRLTQYRNEFIETERQRQRHEAAVTELRYELDALSGYQSVTRQDAHALSVDFARFEILEKELEEIRLSKAEKEEKLSDAQIILTQYEIFDREKEAIDGVLQQLLYKELPDMDTTDAKQPVNHRRWLLTAIILSAMVIAADLLFLRTVLPFSAYISLLIAAIGALGVSSFFFLAKMRSEGQNTTKDWPGKNITKSRQLLMQWMQAVQANDFMDFTRLKGLYENSRQHFDELTETLASLERRGAWTKTRLEELKAKLLSLLDFGQDMDSSDVLTQERIDTWRENYEAYHSLLPALTEAQGAVQACTLSQEGILREASLVCGEKIVSIEDLEEFLQTTGRGLERVPADVMLKSSSIEGIDYAIEEIHEALRQNQLKANTLATRLENIPDDETLQQAHERVGALRGEKEKLLFLGKALDTAIETLTEAGLVIQRDYVPALNREMGEILSAVTAGKYKGIKADDSLTLKLAPQESTEEVLPDQLSSGTMDQIYLALRLAAVRIVEIKGETLPLFLDEPFAQYDESRTKEALVLLERESKTRQILLFTCKKREVELVREVFHSEPANIIELS
ncbi:MAG: AAA family ATPase [Thermoclostridium sp.]|nr:AAA family ATPase [Thermoclostridium sp.]